MDEWEFFNPTRVLFRWDSLERLAELTSKNETLLITTRGFRKRGVLDTVEGILDDVPLQIMDDVTPNPDIDHIDEQISKLRGTNIKTVIVLGGGSSIDTGKAVSRILSEKNTTLGEHLRDSKPLRNEHIRLIAIPTTSGTGAEVTPFATIWDRRDCLKRSLGDTYPDIALVDPKLTCGLPDDMTLYTGLDAMSHALESVWNRNMMPVSYMFARRSLSLSLKALPRLVTEGESKDARMKMAEASLLAGLAISQTRTSMAHAISYPLTLRFEMPHGLACGFTLPAILRFNSGTDDGRLYNLSRDLGFQGTEGLIDHLEGMFSDMEMEKHIRRFIKGEKDLDDIVDVTSNLERFRNNMRKAGKDDIMEILKESRKK